MAFGRHWNHVGMVLGGLLILTVAPGYQKKLIETEKQVTTMSESQPVVGNRDALNNRPDSFKKQIATDPPPAEATTPKQDETLLNGSKSKESPATAEFARPQPLSFRNPGKLTELDKTYLDAFSILKQDNSCSQFFGGSPAIEVLNRLTRQLKPTYIDRSIGMRMSGRTALVWDYRTGISYRLFEKAEVNLDGPFYRGNTMPTQPHVPSIGSFEPNTREARVTLLLHELGHLVRKPDTQWLLPDDGKDLNQSLENTRRLIAVCGDQIRSLSKLTFAQELLNIQSEALSAGAPAGGPVKTAFADVRTTH